MFLSMTYNNKSQIILWTLRGLLTTLAVKLMLNCRSPLWHHQGNRNGLFALV